MSIETLDVARPCRAANALDTSRLVRQVDIAIVGGGTAGLGALREVRTYTQSFVIINEGPWGTLCARAGCMPSKALIEAANAYHRRKDFAEFGIAFGDALPVDTAAVLARVRKIRDELVHEAQELTKGLEDRAIDGRARLLGPDRLTVGGQEVVARRIILATGSHPVMPEKWRSLADRLLTTDTLFEQPSLPRRIAVLGLGPVGAEMAQALARLGCDVTAFDSKKHVAGLHDPVVNSSLLAALRKDLRVHMEQEAELRADGDGVRVTAGDVAVVVDRVLVALGREPNLEGLGLETLGAALDRHGRPEIDPATLQIAKLPIFLAGDAAGDRPILHEASDEGHIAGRNARDEVRAFHRRVPLNIVFTSPNAVVVGKRYQELKASPHLVGEADFSDQGRARLGLRGGGMLRIYADPASGALLGAELATPDGEHLGHFLALAIERRCTALELLRAPFYHPCLQEGVRDALRDIVKTVNGKNVSELG